DRKLGIICPPIDDARRLTEAKLVAAVEAARPVILGALLSAVSMGLRRWDVVGDGPKPRMADFMQWIAACEPALGWKPGTLVEVYAAYRQESAETVVESSAVGVALLKFMKSRFPDGWEGTLEELLAALEEFAAETGKKDARRWPRTGRGLRGTLDRLAPDLRRLAWRVEFSRTNVARNVCIRPSPPSPPSPESENPSNSSGVAGDGRGDGCDPDRHPESRAFSRPGDGSDGGDG